jgi:hypothetical protein
MKISIIPDDASLENRFLKIHPPARQARSGLPSAVLQPGRLFVVWV